MTDKQYPVWSKAVRSLPVLKRPWYRLFWSSHDADFKAGIEADLADLPEDEVAAYLDSLHQSDAPSSPSEVKKTADAPPKVKEPKSPPFDLNETLRGIFESSTRSILRRVRKHAGLEQTVIDYLRDTKDDNEAKKVRIRDFIQQARLRHSKQSAAASKDEDAPPTAATAVNSKSSRICPHNKPSPSGCLDCWLDRAHLLREQAQKMSAKGNKDMKDLCVGARTTTSPDMVKLAIPIPLDELQPGQTHRDRLIQGKLLTDPAIVDGVFTVLEDPSQHCVRLCIFNCYYAHLTREESESKLRQEYQKGRQVTVLEPVFKAFDDGSFGIEITNAEKCLLFDQPLVTTKYSAAAWKKLGTHYFSKQNHKAAALCYSRALVAYDVDGAPPLPSPKDVAEDDDDADADAGLEAELLETIDVSAAAADNDNGKGSARRKKKKKKKKKGKKGGDTPDQAPSGKRRRPHASSTRERRPSPSTTNKSSDNVPFDLPRHAYSFTVVALTGVLESMSKLYLELDTPSARTATLCAIAAWTIVPHSRVAIVRLASALGQLSSSRAQAASRELNRRLRRQDQATGVVIPFDFITPMLVDALAHANSPDDTDTSAVLPVKFSPEDDSMDHILLSAFRQEQEDAEAKALELEEAQGGQLASSSYARAQRYLKAAEEEMEAGQGSLALSIYSLALDLLLHGKDNLPNADNPDDEQSKSSMPIVVALLSNRAACSLELQRFTQAACDSLAACLLSPSSLKAYYRLSSALLSLQYAPSALDVCRQGLRRTDVESPFLPAFGKLEKRIRGALNPSTGGGTTEHKSSAPSSTSAKNSARKKSGGGDDGSSASVPSGSSEKKRSNVMDNTGLTAWDDPEIADSPLLDPPLPEYKDKRNGRVDTATAMKIFKMAQRNKKKQKKRQKQKGTDQQPLGLPDNLVKAYQDCIKPSVANPPPKSKRAAELRRLLQLPGDTAVFDLIQDATVPPFHTEFVLKCAPPSECKVGAYMNKLTAAFTYTQSIGFYEMRLLSAHPDVWKLVLSEELSQRLWEHKESAEAQRTWKWWAGAQYGEVSFLEDREEAGYRNVYPDVWQPLCTTPRIHTILAPGTTHVSVGFMDMTDLLYSVLERNQHSRPGPLRWIGYEASAFCVARALVLEELLRGEHTALHIGQIWFSSVWCEDTLQSFRAATRRVIQQVKSSHRYKSEEPNSYGLEESMVYLKHWAKVKPIPLAEVRDRWAESQPVDRMYAGNLKKTEDRVAYCRYFLTGEIPFDVTSPAIHGNVFFFSPPHDTKLTEAYDVLRNVPSYRLWMFRSSNHDIMKAVGGLLLSAVMRLRGWLKGGKVMLEFHLVRLDPELTPLALEEIRKRKPYSMSWSTLCDYFEPSLFHTMLRKCSLPSTVHHVVSLTWQGCVKGASILDYPSASVRREMIADSRKFLQKPENWGAVQEYVFIGKPKHHIVPVVDALLAHRFYAKWTDKFLQRSGQHRITSVRAQVLTYDVLARFQAPIHLAFAYDDSVVLATNGTRK